MVVVITLFKASLFHSFHHTCKLTLSQLTFNDINLRNCILIVISRNIRFLKTILFVILVFIPSFYSTKWPDVKLILTFITLGIEQEME